MTKYVLIALSFFLIAPTTTHAAINVGETTYSGDENINDLLDTTILKETISGADKLLDGEVTIQDAIETGKDLKNSAEELSNKSGIDIRGILKTIGSWFIVAAEFMIKIVRWIVSKL